MSSLQLVPEYKKDIQREAQILADVMEKNFLASITRATKLLPEQSHDFKEELIFTYIDALITTTVGICGSYVNSSSQFEEVVQKAVADKFVILRKMQLEGRLP